MVLRIELINCKYYFDSLAQFLLMEIVAKKAKAHGEGL